MKVYCGDYWKYTPPRRFPWKRLALITLGAALTMAATPAMVSYYWNGQHSAETLAFEEARRILVDTGMPETRRTSAAGRVFVNAKGSIKALLQAGEGGDKTAADSRIYLNKLKQLLKD